MRTHIRPAPGATGRGPTPVFVHPGPGTRVDEPPVAPAPERLCPAAEESLRIQRIRELVEFFFRLVFCVAVPLLEEAGELVALPGDGRQVVVGQLAPLLFHFAGELLPVARDLIPIHDEPPRKLCPLIPALLSNSVAASCRR